jgi:hypothetical protein
VTCASLKQVALCAGARCSTSSARICASFAIALSTCRRRRSIQISSSVLLVERLFGWPKRRLSNHRRFAFSVFKTGRPITSLYRPVESMLRLRPLLALVQSASLSAFTPFPLVTVLLSLFVDGVLDFECPNGVAANANTSARTIQAPRFMKAPVRSLAKPASILRSRRLSRRSPLPRKAALQRPPLRLQ